MEIVFAILFIIGKLISVPAQQTKDTGDSAK